MKATRVPLPVMMIHGAFCGGWVFDTWAEAFTARGYQVTAPTLRHHDEGRKPSPALGDVGLIDYAADLEVLIDRMPALPVLVGHSMGGLLAQMLAARGKARAMILLAPSAPWGVMPSTPLEIMSAQTLFLAGDFWRRPLVPEPWVASTHALDRLDPATHDAVIARMVPESGLATFEILHWPFDFARASAVDPRRVTCPILCFAGSADRINPSGTVRRVAGRYRGNAVFRELGGFSHWPMAEPGWEAVAGHALSWLDGVLEGA